MDFLEMVLREETILRQECGIRYRIRESRLPRLYKLLPDFDFTTNVEEKAWAEYLGDPVSTRAILDRIFHHAVKIEIRGPSYRKRQCLELQKKYEKHQ